MEWNEWNGVQWSGMEWKGWDGMEWNEPKDKVGTSAIIKHFIHTRVGLVS